MKHEKISSHHLERKAILYVRQSSAHQVLHNRESGALQYAMRHRLATLGWSCIETIDDDLGRPRRAALRGRASTGWSPRSAWARSVRSRRGKCRALPATAAIGSS